MENEEEASGWSKNKIRLLLGGLFMFTGIGKIWLWIDEASNDFGLYLGIVLVIGAIIVLWGVRKNA